MASTYSTSLKIQLIGNGEQSGIWGSTTNTNWNLIEQAVAGVQSIVMSNANYVLSNPNGLPGEARNMVLVLTGTNSSICQIIAPLVPKVYIVSNQTVGGYAVTIGGSSGSLVTIPNGITAQVYCDGANFYAAETGAVGTFNVSTLTASRVVVSDASKNLASSSVTVTELGYLSGATSNIQAQINSISSTLIPAGTRMLFAQASAPTGWTQITSYNDYALRVVSGTGGGTGGSVAFSTAFSSQAVSGTIGATALTTAQIPSHTHTFTTGTTSNNHTHGMGISAGTIGGGGLVAGGFYANECAVTRGGLSTDGQSADHTHSGTTNGTGSGATHTHTLTGSSINLAVQYVDVIICSKN